MTVPSIYGIPLLNVPDEGKVEEITQGSNEMTVTVEADQKVTAGYIEIPTSPNPATLEVEAFFGTISGAVWPDMNIKSPKGEWFGYGESFLNSESNQEDITNQSSTKATYTGWGSENEKMTFENPVSGKWYVEIRHTGGQSTSTFNIKSNYAIVGTESGTNPETIKTPPQLNLQVTGNEGGTFSIDLTDARTTALGIDALVVDSREKAEEAISLIDKAINIVSYERITHGVYSNSLEHIKANITNYKTSLSAAESHIKDLDIAKEITKLANKQILLQSSQAMLTQSNQIPQSILQFLK